MEKAKQQDDGAIKVHLAQLEASMARWGLEEELATRMMDAAAAGLAGGVPWSILEALLAWWAIGRPTGSFTKAVLCNDLWLAVFRADQVSLARLREIVGWCHWHLPRDCCGSRKRVNAWAEKHRERRKEVARHG